MNDIKKLKDILSLFPAIIGIGNPLRGDDGAGVLLVEGLIRNGYSNALIVGATPENYLMKITQMPGEARLWVDVINWNAQPGDWRIFEKQEIGQYAVSTHNFSPVVLTDFLSTTRNVPDYFLGIQPEKLNLGDEITPAVKSTVNELTNTIIQAFRKRSAK